MPYYAVARHTKLLRPYASAATESQDKTVLQDLEVLQAQPGAQAQQAQQERPVHWVKRAKPPAPRVSALVMYNSGSKPICQSTVESILKKSGISGKTIDNLPDEGNARVILFVMFVCTQRIGDEQVEQPYKAWLQHLQAKKVIVLALRRGNKLQAMAPNPHITGAAKILEFRFMKTLNHCDTNTRSLAELKDAIAGNA